MESGLHICSSEWDPEDRVAALANIFEQTSHEDIIEKLVKYVTENIEPTGWRGVWRCDDNGESDEDYIVAVNHVHLDELTADVILLQPLTTDEIEVSIPLLQLFPLAEQDNPHLDIAGTTEVLDQVRFFMNHLLLPWDSEEEHLVYDHALLAERMKVFTDSTNGVIPTVVLKEMEKAVEEGFAISIEIDRRETEEFQLYGLPDIMALHRRMDTLKCRYNMLKNPILREMALLQKQAQTKLMLGSMAASSAPTPKVLIVASQVSPVEFVEIMATLPPHLEVLPNYRQKARVQTIPTLQIALDVAAEGDTVVLLPGNYILNKVGALAKGGDIIGIGGNVEISGSWASGDILFDLHPTEGKTFTLKSVTIQGFRKQTAITLHRGKLLIANCKFKDCLLGLSLLESSSAIIEGCSFENSVHYDVIRAPNTSLKVVGVAPVVRMEKERILEHDVEKVMIMDEDKESDVIN